MSAGGNFPTRMLAHLDSNADKWVPYNAVAVLGGFKDVARVAQYPLRVRAMSSASSSSSAGSSPTASSDGRPNDVRDEVGCYDVEVSAE